jgi:hypothetical protein
MINIIRFLVEEYSSDKGEWEGDDTVVFLAFHFGEEEFLHFLLLVGTCAIRLFRD